MTDYDVKFFIGPMSENVVDAVIEVNKDIDLLQETINVNLLFLTKLNH